MTSVLDLKRAIAEMEDFQDDAVRKNVIEILKGHTATLQQQLTDLKDKEKKEKEEASAAAAAATASKKQPKKRFESSDEEDSDDSDDGKPAPPPPAAKKPAAAAAKPVEPEHPSEFKAEEAARRTAREEREAAERAAHAADLAAEKDEVAVAAALEAKQVAKKLASAVEAVKELEAFAEDAKSDRVRVILEAQAKEVATEREELKEECAALEEKVQKAKDAARTKFLAKQEKPAEKKPAPAAEPSDDDEEEVAPPPKKENPMIAMAKKRAAEQAARAKAEEEEEAAADEEEEEEKRAAAEKAAKKKAKAEAAAAKAKAEEEEAEAEEEAAQAAAKEEAKKAKAAAKAKAEEEEEEEAAAAAEEAEKKAAAEKKAKEAEAEKKVERKDSHAGGALKKSESMRAAPGEMQVDGVGSGMIDELQDVLDDSKVQFGLVKIPMGSGTLARNKMIFVQWLGERCNAIKRMKHLQKVPEVAKLFGATHATYNISEKDDCTLEAACKDLKGVFVTDSSGSFSTKALRAEMEARIKALGPASPTRARKTAKEMGIGDDTVMTEMRKNLGRFNWCLWEPELPLKLFNAGSKSIDEMHSHLDESKVLFGLLRLGFGKGTFRRTKWVCITFVGQSVGAVSRGRQVQKRGEMEKELKPFSMSLEIQGKEEATIESILNRVKDFVVSDDLGGEEITVETFQEALAEEIQENAEFFGDEENEVCSEERSWGRRNCTTISKHARARTHIHTHTHTQASFSDDFMQVIKKIHQDNSGVMWGCFSYA